MKNRTGLTLVNTLFAVTAVSGWVICAVNFGALQDSRQEANQFAELNDILIEDAHKGLVASVPRPAVIERKDGALITALQAKNQDLKTKLTDLKNASEKKIQAILANKAPLPRPTPETPVKHQTAAAVQLGTLAVTAHGASYRAPADTLPPPDGKIVTLDPEGRYVVISLGQKNGVMKGTQFVVYDHDAVKAILHVFEVRQQLSACRISCKEAACELSTGEAIYFSKKT